MADKQIPNILRADIEGQGFHDRHHPAAFISLEVTRQRALDDRGPMVPAFPKWYHLRPDYELAWRVTRPQVGDGGKARWTWAVF
jgi:hypothetical protein